MRTLLFLLVLALTARAQIHPSLPEPGTLDGLGVNIHFTEPQPGELEMIRAAGFRWVRMDFTWAATEPEPGRYDFAKYDSLVAALEKANLRAYFILDYGHPKFADAGDKHPFTSRAGTPEFRDAFAKWAVAAVGHFKGRGIVWELWNEPNIAGFWKPKPDVQQYIALAKTVAAALEKAGLRTKSRTFPPGTKRDAAGECLVGPATSVIDLPFLDACFAAGLLEVFDAISVHPYRQGAPESVVEEYRALRLLIRRHCAADALPLGTYDPSRPNPARRIPILSGEWGYSAAWPSLGKDEAAREATQAKYLPRMFLTNVANDIPLSIWYDWRGDGDDPKEAEHRFGIVRRKPTGDAKQPFEPKPAYTAMKVMCEQLKGMRFDKTFRSLDGEGWLIKSWEDSLAKQIGPRCPHPEVEMWSGERGHCLVSFTESDKSPPTMEFPSLWNVEHCVTHLGADLVPKPSAMPAIPGINSSGADLLPTLPGLPSPNPAEWPKWKFLVKTGPEYRHFHPEDSSPLLIECWKRLPLELVGSAPTEYEIEIAFANRLKHKIPLLGWKESQRLFLWPFGEREELYGNSTVLLEPGATAIRQHGGFCGRMPKLGEEFVPLEVLHGPRRLYFVQTLRTMPGNPMHVRFVGATGGEVMPLEEDFPDPETLKFVKKAGFKPRHKPVDLMFEIRRESDEPLTLPFRLEDLDLDTGIGVGEAVVEFAQGERVKLVRIQVDHLWSMNTAILGELGKNVVGSLRMEIQQVIPQPFSSGRLSLFTDGDAAVASTQSLADGQPAEGASVSGTPSVGLRYRFGAGWKFVRIEPKDATARKIEGGPRAFGIWVHGDGQGGTPCIRLRDATGQVHQVRGEPVSWKGWRYVTFPLRPAADSGQTMIPLPDAGAEQRVSWSHWGGANDGEVHGPIEWDTLFLLDGNRQAMDGEIFLSAPTLVY